MFESNTHAPKAKRLFSGLAIALAAAFCLGSASQASAASKEGITVTVSGLGCTTSAGSNAFKVASWSWGAASSGGPTPRTDLADLSVSKFLDACSPALFGGVGAARPFGTVTLVQTDDNGAAIVTVTLSGATISSWQVGSSGEKPVENVSFSFATICVQENTSGNKVCSGPKP
jgi:type VI protein secretion system component Hcp